MKSLDGNSDAIHELKCADIDLTSKLLLIDFSAGRLVPDKEKNSQGRWPLINWYQILRVGKSFNVAA